MRELGHGGALAARDDEGVDGLQLLRLPYLHPFHPYPPQRCAHQILTFKGKNTKKQRRDWTNKKNVKREYPPCAR